MINTNNLKKSLVKTVEEIKENIHVPVLPTTSVKYLNVYIPMQYWRAKSFKETLNKFLNDAELTNNLSSTQIIITLNSIIKDLLDSENISQDVVSQLAGIQERIENAKEYRVLVPIRGVKMYLESFDFGEWSKIVSIKEDADIFKAMSSSSARKSFNYLIPVALEFKIKCADHLKAIELAVEGSKVILHFLRLIDYITWNDEDSLGLRLPGFGTSTDELRVVAIEGESQYDWQLKEAAEEEFDIDTAYVEDAKKYGVRKFGEYLDSFLYNTQTVIGKSVLRSLVWFGESRMDHDIASRFLKLMLAIECLLNTNEDAPITATLSERVAFILGDDVEGRLKLVKQMKHLYRLRSKITHHGSTNAGQEDLWQLEAIVAELIVVFLTNSKYEIESKEELNRMMEFLKYK